MNTRQKLYELKSQIFNYTQKSDISNYFQLLHQINTRPNKHLFPREKITLKKVIYEPFKDPSVIESNRKNQLKIYSIIDECPLPKINHVYLKVREKLRDNKERIRQIAERALSVENTKYQDRVLNQKPRVENIRRKKHLKIHSFRRYSRIIKNSMKKEYSMDYQKLESKKSEKEDVKLPDINKYGNGEKLFQTEININNNSVNESDTEKGEKLKDHKYKEISHLKQGYLEG